MTESYQNDCQNNTEKGVRSTRAMPRMRTVNEAARELKALDPHTAMTAYHIRCLCLTGTLPTVKAGKKILLNLDTLIEYMQDPHADKFQPCHVTAAAINGIRRIS